MKRHKRFLADVKLRNGHIVTAHCPNSGSMAECSEPGRTVYLSRHNNPKRKLKYTWEMIDMPTSLVGVNTMVPNRLVKASIEAGRVKGLSKYENVKSEVKYGENSRIDLLLAKEDEDCFVEIKNCTLVEKGIAYFPDAVTSRGLKHLFELQNEVRNGNRSVMFYLVQRMDAKLFRPADHIDSAYGKELRKAAKNGVEIFVYDVGIDIKGIQLNRPLPYEI
jgi:sugar fermentation stimulation protein A